jgi:hypothetical protein
MLLSDPGKQIPEHRSSVQHCNYAEGKFEWINSDGIENKDVLFVEGVVTKELLWRQVAANC